MYGDRISISGCLGVGVGGMSGKSLEEMGMIANWYRGSSYNNKNVLKWW